MRRPSRITLGEVAKAHISEAEAVHAQFQQFKAAGDNRWAPTALFYSALHLVDAWFIGMGHIRPHRHEVRSPLVRSELPQIWASYRELDSASRDARYEMTFPNTERLRRLEENCYEKLRAVLA